MCQLIFLKKCVKTEILLYYTLCVGTFHLFNIKLPMTYCGVGNTPDAGNVQTNKIRSLLCQRLQISKVEQLVGRKIMIQHGKHVIQWSY